MSTGSTLRWDDKDETNRKFLLQDLDNIVDFIVRNTGVKVVSKTVDLANLSFTLKMEKVKK